MGKWINGLRSGQYKQAFGCLEDYAHHNCCLGVRHRIEGDEPEWDNFEGTYRFDDAFDMPSQDKQAEWDLDIPVTDYEFDLIKDVVSSYDPDSDIGFTYYTGTTNTIKRGTLLATLNDETAIGFKGIADVLEACGWDNSDNREEV